MAILQLDLWGNPVAVPEKEESTKGSASSFKQETFNASSLPPSLPLFKEEEGNEEIYPNKKIEKSETIFVQMPSAEENVETSYSDEPVEVLNQIIKEELLDEIVNEPINIEAPLESINREEIVIEDTNSGTTSAPQFSEEDQVVYSDTQILVKLKGRPKGSANQEIVKKEVPTTYSSINTPGKRGRKSFKEIDGSVDLVNVPDDETLKKKLYHGISEVADWFGVNNSQIRYWENEFDVLKPRKTRKGDRLFRYEDIKTLQLIHHLLRNRKFSIEGAKDYLKSNKQQADTHFELIKTLNKFRSFLLELRSNLGV